MRRWLHIYHMFLFQGPEAPLYLGADIFSNTDIRTENHPRYHAKFAKKGLATKIHFSSGERKQNQSQRT